MSIDSVYFAVSTMCSLLYKLMHTLKHAPLQLLFSPTPHRYLPAMKERYYRTTTFRIDTNELNFPAKKQV